MWRSYQANFASHHTHDRHVGFLLACNGIGKHNKMSPYFLFNSYHNTKLKQSDKNISTHTLGGNFKSFCEVNRKFQRFLLFSSIPHHTKGNQAAGQNHLRIGAYRVVQTLAYRCVSRRANPLLINLIKTIQICFLMLCSYVYHNLSDINTWHPFTLFTVERLRVKSSL